MTAFVPFVQKCLDSRGGSIHDLNLWDEIANGKFSCPTHSVQVCKLENGLNIHLDANAALDRDFVLLMDGIGGKSHCLAIKDDDKWLGAASFAPDMQKQEISPIALKILVDCSGSMNGDSIRQARKGLGEILKLLTEKDQVSYSRFGSSVAHMTNTMLPYGPETLRRLSKAIEKTDADMGGTEMNDALQSTCKCIKCPGDNELPPVILLITDGDVWDVKNIIRDAKASGHRIFVIGVGNAPAESLLRDLAQQTNGACEFVTENENIAQAIVRMFFRMRGAIASHIKIDWHIETEWQSANPSFIYDGETVHGFAIFKSEPKSGPVLSWEAGGQKYSEGCDHVASADDEDLVRLGHMLQVEETKSKKEKLAIALKYQLVTDITSLILVYEREEDEKVTGLPKIQQVPQMPAYGHGCNAKFVAPLGALVVDSLLFGLRGPQSEILYEDDGHADQDELGSKICADKMALLEEITALWNLYICNIDSVTKFFESTLKAENLESISDLFSELAANSPLTMEQIYAAFMLWLLEKENDLSRHSLRILNHASDGADEKEMENLRARMDQWLQSE